MLDRLVSVALLALLGGTRPGFALTAVTGAASARQGDGRGHSPLTSQTPSEVGVELVPAITRAEIEAHVRFLASNELRGRPTGTPEAERAARYLAAVLAQSGVAPAGDDGGFLQSVPLERTRSVAPAELCLSTRSGATIEGEDGVDFDPPFAALAATDLSILVVREAGDVPAKPDVRTALFVDAPAGKRRKLLEEAGRPEGAGFGLLIQPGRSNAREPSARDDRSRSHGSALRRVRADEARAVAVLRVHGELLERLRKGEFERLSLATHVEREPVAAWNVVGRIDGVGGVGTPEKRELAREAIVFSAHYDHLPDRSAPAPASAAPGAQPDLVHNGADDDASGCAAVLELAGALRAGPPPARTLVFLLATGEEIGLLGTQHYLDHPVVALERTVFNLNFEMIGRPDALIGGAGRLWLTGFELSNLGPACTAAKLPIVADPRPSEHFFERSDNIAFVRRGIVGQSLSSYDLHTDYHQVTDEADRLDYAHMEAAIRAAAAAAQKLVSGELTPRWTEAGERKPR